LSTDFPILLDPFAFRAAGRECIEDAVQAAE
jgi:hypothetical protein